MSRNGYSNPQTGPMILVLYKIVNSESDGVDDLYNCFQMPYGKGITLNSIKHNCVAAHSLSHLGPEGYHYRVMMEDKTGTDRSFSWWDIQDGNAKLPVKETSQYELRKLLFPSSKSSSGSSAISSETATKAAKGAFKMMGKAMASAIGDEGGVENHGPPVSVIVVKMLDLVKIHNEHDQKHGGGGGHAPSTPKQQRPRRVAPPQKSRHPAPTPARTNANSRPTPSRPQPTARRAQPAAPAGGGGNLMDFGDAPSSGRVLHHSSSMPNNIDRNETRAQRLKRQNEQKLKTSNRVWDDIDKRWVEVDSKKSNSNAGAAGRPGAAPNMPKKKAVAVKLDMSNAAGKSAQVQRAMQDRVNEMNATRQKAVQEVKEREALKKKREDEEDAIRVQLEPKIKAWAEEYGKKKQLQALLASLHTILWKGTKWKTISMGDILQPAKVKKFYFKATLVVHPDKTHDLPAEQRFLAKRIFDALSQAKTVWDEQSQGR